MNVHKKAGGGGNEKARAKRVIRLEDLGVEDDVVGGTSQKLIFGEKIVPVGKKNGFGNEAGYQDGHDLFRK